MSSYWETIFTPIAAASLVGLINAYITLKESFKTNQKIALGLIETKITAADGVKIEADRYISTVNDFMTETEVCRLDREKDALCDISGLSMNQFTELPVSFYASLRSADGGEKLHELRIDLETNLRDYKRGLKELLSTPHEPENFESLMETLNEVSTTVYAIVHSVNLMIGSLHSEESRLRGLRYRPFGPRGA